MMQGTFTLQLVRVQGAARQVLGLLAEFLKGSILLGVLLAVAAPLPPGVEH
jgi:hypothetical protein